MKTRHQRKLEENCGPTQQTSIANLDRWQITIIKREQPNPELTESIKKHGIRHPIIITPDHIILDGTQRVTAALSLGHTTIPTRTHTRERRRHE